MIIPDQVHIDALRDALWSGPMYGRAAVMVGSGYSLNADAIEPGSAGFPTWGMLMETLINQLTNAENGSKEATDLRNSSQSVSGALRLSQEFLDLHDRVRLDNLIKTNVPDMKFVPSDLHQLLLELPWSDVFTTNWDTLLERASDRVVERRYERVLTMEDIPFALRPRIVKLHGSFPSSRPFIFTEDDFRSYPTEFAPFVNLVQQSMMENVFCLVGFSGDDPNFLAWSGWIRDNLGDQRPTIYLVGLSVLRPGQRRMLEKRKITPIDLSGIFLPPANNLQTSQKYALAYRWFIRNLMAGRPADETVWPEPPPPSELDQTLVNFTLPIPANTSPVPLVEKFMPDRPSSQ